MVVAHPIHINRHLCMAIDMQGYGGRAGGRHPEIQQDLVGLIDRAAARVGLDHDRWEPQKSGDGQFAVLPVDQSEVLVVDDFVRELDVELRRFNEYRRDDWRIRLRLAIHYGPVAPAANGFAGSAPVTVGRLLDSRPLRRALAVDEDRYLALMLSRQVFEDTVAADHTSLRTGDFLPVRVRVKEFDDTAWLRVPGMPATELKRALEADDAVRPPSGQTSGLEESPTRVDQKAEADDGAAVQQTGRDLTGTRYGGGAGPTYVNNTTFNRDVEMNGGVIGYNFGDGGGRRD
jgi:hypothetical protein